MESTLLVFALLVAGVLFVRGPGHMDRRSIGLVAASLGLVFAGWGFRALEGENLLHVALPAPVREGGFVSSGTCRSCHPGEYHSWHQS